MISYPILFGYRDLIGGRGFVAFVQANGRALLTEDAENAWLYGVNPGGIAGGGSSRDDAVRRFKDSYLSVLYDIAAEAQSFDEFKQEVERFFYDVHEPNEREWSAAHAAVKSGDLTTDLPQVKAETRPTRIDIRPLETERVQPDVNQLQGELAEAA